ncbi:MAG: hypothetical protein JWO85_3222 [Candidatus Eremiobacteraeota bacterium]|jgi:hypothetical protein|nr:hypothetical protein [Candidatus Eremiobacteraeota bacterium]
MASPVPENDEQLPITRRVDIARPRLVRALEAHGSYSLTIVNAPIGSGTTTLLRQFAACRDDLRYVDVRGMREPQLRAALLGQPDLAAVILDHLDLAEPDAVASLMRGVASDRGLGRRVIIGAHARRSVQAQELVARGIAATIDASDLAFLPEEVQRLATALGVEHTAEDVAELLHVTEGWPLALSWILRNAADEGRPMRGAFDLWSKRRGHLLVEFLEETDALAAAARGRFSALLRSGSRDGDRELAALESFGFPVVRTRTGFRPYRLLTRLSALTALDRAPSDDVEKLTLVLFGRFRCTVGGRPVNFARRRDRSVLTYIALSPGARASRSELLAAFWPGVPCAVSSPGLRTTLSRLRRVIAAAAGRDADHFLVFKGPFVAVNLEHAQIDACRFADHIAQGRLDDERGDLDAAREHFQTAERLYAGQLLSSEAVEPALAPRVSEYASLFESALARLVAMRVTASALASSAGSSWQLAQGRRAFPVAGRPA